MAERAERGVDDAADIMPLGGVDGELGRAATKRQLHDENISSNDRVDTAPSAQEDRGDSNPNTGGTSRLPIRLPLSSMLPHFYDDDFLCFLRQICV